MKYALWLLFLLQDASDKAKETLEQLRSKHGEGFTYEAFGYIAHACKADERQTARTNQFLKTYSKFAKEFLFPKEPALLKVVSFQQADEFYKFAGRRGISGYYAHGEKQLVNNLNDGLGTCGHEMTHALMFADWPGGRPHGWFVEGLGALLENCLRKKDGTFVGVGISHWRFPGLRKKIEAGTYDPLRTFMQKPGTDINCYVQGRWVLTFLVHQGLMRKFYDEYKASGDPSGIQALEKVTGRKVEDFEKAWVEWSKGLEVEVIDIRGQDYPVLGVVGRATDEGFKIVSVSLHSTAAAAGVRPGDVLREIDGTPVKTMKEMIDVLRSKKNGDKVDVKINDKSISVTLDQFIDG